MIINTSTNAGFVTSETLRHAIGMESRGLSFSGVGDIHSNHSDRTLSFIKDKKYLSWVNENRTIAAIFCEAATVGKLRPDILPLVVEDPNWLFFTLIDYLGKTRTYQPSALESSVEGCNVSVSRVGVQIGEGVKLEDFVVVKQGTLIHDRVLVRSGAVLGLDTFQHQRTSRGMISPSHDGDLIIESDAEIGAQSTISKGFSYRPTVISFSSKLDAGVYVGHGAHIGSEAIVCAGAKIMGHCRIGDGAFIGPGAVVSSRIKIGSGARVSVGAVVTRDVCDGETVSGNFAVPHKTFLAGLKKSLQS